MASMAQVDTEKYGVTVEPAEVALGQTYWRMTEVHHLTPQENRGNHHLFLKASDEYGQPVPGARVRVSWDGGQEDVLLDEPGDEAETGFPMSKGHVYSVQAIGLPADLVSGLHVEHPDEGAGNMLYRHSFRLSWQRVTKKVFSHYVMFGPPEDGATQANMIIALGYILKFKPAFGFKIEEAALADRVTIIGGVEQIPYEVQDQLEEAGCWVHRIEGDSRAIDRVLTDLQRRGVPFPQ
jgi:hypothetical protein